MTSREWFVFFVIAACDPITCKWPGQHAPPYRLRLEILGCPTDVAFQDNSMKPCSCPTGDCVCDYSYDSEYDVTVIVNVQKGCFLAPHGCADGDFDLTHQTCRVVANHCDTQPCDNEIQVTSFEGDAGPTDAGSVDSGPTPASDARTVDARSSD
jgi:hypothetical protein